MIPYFSVDNIISYLRGISERVSNAVITFGDDGEKFGAWPQTYSSVYSEGWLERFFSKVEENSDWLEMIHFSEAIDRFPSKGRIYLPGASYSEMMEWALPAKIIPEYRNFIEMLEKGEILKAGMKFIRGNNWRNFLVKYPESNLMQKKACYVSSKIPNTTPEILKNDLFRGECNCGYWHGIYGGVYLPHLRHSNYSHLIKAEYSADVKRIKNKRDWLKKRVIDFDCDGYDEVILENSLMNLYISPGYGGSIFELDIKGKKNINLMNTISRKEEGYHLLEKEKFGFPGLSEEKNTGADSAETDEGIGKARFVDWYLRRSFIDHILSLDCDINKFSKMSFWEMGDFVKEPYSFEARKSRDFYFIKQQRKGNLFVPIGKVPWLIDKRIEFYKNSTNLVLTVSVTNISDTEFSCIYGSEFNFSLPGAPGSGRIIYRDKEKRPISGINASGMEHSLLEFGLDDREMEIDINFIFDQEMNLWFFPIETVSRSGKDFDKIYQGSCFLFNKKLDLNPGESWRLKMNLKIKDTGE